MPPRPASLPRSPCGSDSAVRLTPSLTLQSAALTYIFVLKFEIARAQARSDVARAAAPRGSGRLSAARLPARRCSRAGVAARARAERRSCPEPQSTYDSVGLKTAADGIPGPAKGRSLFLLDITFQLVHAPAQRARLQRLPQVAYSKDP